MKISSPKSVLLRLMSFVLCMVLTVGMSLTAFATGSEQTSFETVFENTDKYIYRVGNLNSVKLENLFTVIDGQTVNSNDVSVSVTPLDENTDVTAVYTANSSDWTQSTLKFSGTGVVSVAIQNGVSEAAVLNLEIVNGKNITDYSQLNNQNPVLLADITMSEGSQWALTGATLYGNGFTFDVTQGCNRGPNGLQSSNYLIRLQDAVLDNVKVVGAVYTQYGAHAADSYNNPVVLSVGDSKILNSYISNCASPVRVVDGDLLIQNTTLKGGNFANLDIRNGHVVLDNATTINQVSANDLGANDTVVVGLGVVVYFENVLETTTVEVCGALNQYNHIKKSDKGYIKDPQAQLLFDAMFNYSAVIYNDGNDEWVNTGILSMSSAVGNSNITDVPGYVHVTPTLNGVTGYLHAPAPSAPQTPVAYESAVQGAVAPSSAFDFTSKNYIPYQDGSNSYCYKDGDSVRIAFPENSSFSWDTAILTAEKCGQTLSYTVSMNGTDYTGESIVFSESGDYEVVYTYTDPYNYMLNESGNVAAYTLTYTETVQIKVAAVSAAAQPATFDFGGNGFKKVVIGDKTYVMPDVDTTSAAIASKTVGGQTVYMPIVEMVTSDGRTSHRGQSWYGYFPVFGNAVTITD